MPVFLDTTGNSSLAIGICARCSRKFPIGELSPDRNSPGLLVCRDDNDEKDPYRLPFQPADRDISVPRARPDVTLVTNEDIGVDENGYVIDVPIPTDTEVEPSSN